MAMDGYARKDNLKMAVGGAEETKSMGVILPKSTRYLCNNVIVAPFTKRCRIITTVLGHQFSTTGHSYRAKQCRCKNDLLCNSHRKQALRLLKRRDSTRYVDDVCVLSRCFPGVLSI